MQKYDSIYIVSCVSCSACVTEYLKTKKNNSKNALVFDNNCTSDFILELKNYQHINISQSSLDSFFNNFGNIILLSKNGEVYTKSIPE